MRQVAKTLRFAFLSNSDFNLLHFRLPIMLALMEKGHEVVAICPEGEMTCKFSEYGIRHVHFPLVRASINPFTEFQTYRELRHILKNQKPDLLHTFTIKPNIYGPLVARRLGIKTISSITGIGSIFTDSSRSRLFIKFVQRVVEPFYRASLNQAKKAIFYNTDDLEFFVQKGIVDPQKTSLISGSGVNTRRFRKRSPQEVNQVRKSLELKKGQIAIAMVSRLLADKGVREYLEAAKNLKNVYQEKLAFFLIGSEDTGNMTSLSMNEIETWKKQNQVRFLGQREDIEYLLAAMDIYCLPSYREGLPLSTLEAMSVGLPIVTTDVPGCRDTVNEGKNGLLVAPSDTHALREGIQKLIDDKTLRTRMGKESLRFSKNFSISAVLEQQFQIYEQVLGFKITPPKKKSA